MIKRSIGRIPSSLTILMLKKPVSATFDSSASARQETIMCSRCSSEPVVIAVSELGSGGGETHSESTDVSVDVGTVTPPSVLICLKGGELGADGVDAV